MHTAIDLDVVISELVYTFIQKHAVSCVQLLSVIQAESLFSSAFSEGIIEVFPWKPGRFYLSLSEWAALAAVC